MRSVFFAILLLGVALAGFAVYQARSYVGAYRTALEQERAARADIVPLTEIWVAGRRMRYGEQVGRDDVRAVTWPADAVPEGAYLTEAALFPADDSRPRTVLRTMEKDEPVLAVKITEPGEEAGVSARLAKGMRAFAIRVDVASGVSGFLRPGDRVDVYWSGRTAGADSLEAEVTKLIETGIPLIAVDQSADETDSNPVVARTVTVEASPQQVAALAQAQSTGRLSLSLVGAADDTTASAVDVDQRRLLGIERQQVAVRAPEETCSIRTRRGAEVIDMPIPCTN